MTGNSPQSDYRKEWPIEWQHERRINFLKECTADLIVVYWGWQDILDDYILRARAIEMVLVQEKMAEIVKKIEKNIREIHERRDIVRGIEPKYEKITDDMIERARAYPINELIEFNRAGFAPCPWHDETSPSLHYNQKNNTVHCFGCHKTANPIDWLMDREGLKFQDAVRRLSDG